MSDDLKVLFPNETVTVAGEPIEVHPFYFGQISQVAKFCKPIVETLLSSGIMTITKDGDKSTIKIDDDVIPKLFQILEGGTEPLLCLVAFSVGKPRAFLDTVPMDDGIVLTQTIWEINSNFFVERVIPLIASRLSRFVSIGETSSQDSSVTGTDAPT